MAMNKVPSLILGIGGIGCRIAAGISDMLSEEDRKYVGIVGLDTNVNDLKQLKKHKMKTIQTSDDRKVRNYLLSHPEYQAWFPVSRFLVNRGMLDGAGQIRALSRLATIAAEESNMFAPILQEIKRIRSNITDANQTNLTVMIVGSITGGTGAGLFLQLPYYLRNKMLHSSGLDSIVIRGMFVGPDITEAYQPSPVNRKAVHVNAYACMKELNAFYMMQTDSKMESVLSLDWMEKGDPKIQELNMRKLAERRKQTGVYSEFAGDEEEFQAADHNRTDDRILTDSIANIPYNYVYLIEGGATERDFGNLAAGSIESQVAQIVFTMMFTPVGDRELSVVDNFVLQNVENDGMNRYSSAGLYRLVYPYELAKEYVTLRSVRDLVNNEWMLIDRMYDSEVRQVQELMRTDRTLKIPAQKDSFISYFDKLVKGRGQDLGFLFGEAYDQGQDQEPVSKAESFFKKITRQISAVTGSKEIENKAEACKVNEKKMVTRTAALDEINKVYKRLDEYRVLAAQTVRTNTTKIANDVFPPTADSMAARKNEADCIYQLLAGVHPLTARFLCYTLINRLDTEITKAEKQYRSIDLDEYLTVDFDAKKPDVQKAAAVTDDIPKNRSALANLLIKLGVQESTIDAKKLGEIAKKLSNDVSDPQVDLITQAMNYELSLGVYQLLKERLEKLAENYNQFFQNINARISENNTRVEDLEKLKMPLGQDGVYCSKEAFDTMAVSYQAVNRSELPKDTCIAVFDSLFSIFAKEFSNAGKVMTERAKQQQARQKQQALVSVFRSAVEDTIRTEVSKKGESILNLNVREALAKEYELATGNNPDSSDTYEADVVEYIRGRINDAMKGAVAMIAVNSDTKAANSETAYIAIHPDCAEQQVGVPNADMTHDLYVPETTVATNNAPVTVLIDEEFSPYEIKCMRARYNFVIQDLTRYSPGSDTARFYNERISRMGSQNVREDEYVSVINPHLNRYWHEEGFLPAIDPLQRQIDREETLKAFVYAIGKDLFFLQDTDDEGEARKTWYFMHMGRSRAVRTCGKLIGNSYTDLFRSIPFNGQIKATILALASTGMKKVKGSKTAEELKAGILDDAFIKDLAQIIAEGSDENIFDIFLKMREQMDESEWDDLFTGLKLTLWEYCGFLFDGSERLVNEAFRDIIDTLYKGSSVGKKEAAGKEKLTGNEISLQQRKDALKEERYSR